MENVTDSNFCDEQNNELENAHKDEDKKGNNGEEKFNSCPWTVDVIRTRCLSLQEEQSICSLCPLRNDQVFVGILSVRLRECCICALKSGNGVNMIASTSIPALFLGITSKGDIIFGTLKSSVVMTTDCIMSRTRGLLDVTPFQTKGLKFTSDDALLMSLSSKDCLYSPQKVAKMTLTGKVLQEWEIDKDGKPLFENPGPITENKERVIYVIDGFRRIASLEKKLISSEYRCENLCRFVDLTCDDNLNVFVCEAINHSISVFDKRLHKLGDVSFDILQMKNPMSIGVINRVFYVSHDENKITEFTFDKR